MTATATVVYRILRDQVLSDPRLQVSNHPLVAHFLTKMRNKNTLIREFRQLHRQLCELLIYEATLTLPSKSVRVETPLAPFEGKEISCNVALVPIMRAALQMETPFFELIPTASHVWHIGVYRDESDGSKPKLYLNRLPAVIDPDTRVILIDQMLASAGSSIFACDLLKERGARCIQYVGIVAAPEGVERLLKAHPDVNILTAALDFYLNEKKYIVPGLGDMGQRLNGSEE